MPIARESLYAVRIETDLSQCEIVETGLRLLCGDVVTWQDNERHRAVFAEYFETERNASARRAQLEPCLTDWVGGTDWAISVESLPARDWSEYWKRFFRAERVSDRIVVKPSWESFAARESDCVIELDPGLSFGSGQHPTTRACLRFIDDIAREEPGLSFLDIGCGSGILAIAAAMTGYTDVTAVDIDPVALQTARRNFARNNVDGRIASRATDILALAADREYDVVAANIFADVLCRAADRIRALCCRHLLLAGILTKQYAGVRKVYLEAGFRQARGITGKEWTSGRFARM